MRHCKLKRKSLFADSYLEPFAGEISRRRRLVSEIKQKLEKQAGSLKDFAGGHLYFGLHKTANGWVFREWAPNALEIYMVGEFSDWQQLPQFALSKTGSHGNWEIYLPQDAIKNGQRYYLSVKWENGGGRRLPSYANRVVQDPNTLIFDAQIWQPNEPYKWRNSSPQTIEPPLIYESHIGMAQNKQAIGTYKEFEDNILPKIADAGYNTIQFMALAEHPYYGSFGYHVSNFFAASSRFGNPDELKSLIDSAHGLGLRVVMDLVHSHSVRNELEGLSYFDGTSYLFFHSGSRGVHKQWDSFCFNYGKSEVIHFLLSNCRFWLEEYNIDGYRFDGITSMLYHHHGFDKCFTSYNDYFGQEVDEDAYVYLALANDLIHSLRPDAITIAEDVSGMPGLGASVDCGGCGFDYRMAMGVTDLWFKLMDLSEEDWNVEALAYELLNHRVEEKTISYVESHDQALVGGTTAIFKLIDAAMYYAMSKAVECDIVDRGLALHKLFRLITSITACGGYLNFMGNEFGHPEWIDFPREGNGWSYAYANRKWHLQDDKSLRYHYLSDFDKAMLSLLRENDLLDFAAVLLYKNNVDKVLAFERGGYFFFFNFHPTKSFPDYGVVSLPGTYKLVLDSDCESFGGFGRLTPEQIYHTATVETDSDIRDMLKIYLPCRCGIVLKRIDTKTE